MNDRPFDESSLSEEDQAILRAFATQNEWPRHTDSSPYSKEQNTVPLHELGNIGNDEDVFGIFLTEAAEDIQLIKSTVAQLKNDTSSLDLSYFLTLRRAAHKLRGTSAEMDYNDIASVAGYIEEIAEQTEDYTIPADNALEAISIASTVLEASFVPLQQGSMETADISAYIPDFLAVCAQLSIDPFPNQDVTPSPSRAPQKVDHTPPSAPILPDTAIRIDRDRLNNLMLRAAQLGEQQPALEDAQKQVSRALEELQQAQKNLLQVEASLTPLLAANLAPESSKSSNKFSSSSLIARIQRDTTRSAPPHRKKKHAHHATSTEEPTWDILEVAQFSDREYLLLAFKEAFTRVSNCTTRLKNAYRNLNLAQTTYLQQASQVRGSLLTIQMASFSKLASQLKEIVANSTLGRKNLVEFTVRGETLEIEQDILNALTPPLLQVFQTYTSASMLERIEHEIPYRIWLHLDTVGKEIFIELGFSIDIHGGIIDMLRAPLEQFHGVLNVDDDHANGICFKLQFTGAHGIIQGLLVRVQDVYALVPLSQIQNVTTLEQAGSTENFHLADLLNLPTNTHTHVTDTQKARVHPILILRPSDFLFTTSVGVDEVIDQVESIVKPLPYGKHQPGIRGVAIDSQQNVLLVPDLRRLISLHENNPLSTPSPSQAQHTPHILVADDSTIIRDSVVSMLRRAHYEVTEVKNGKEALRHFTVSTPDIALLDIEMPLLNGYDLLKIIRSEPAFSHMKVIILTSRAADKHRQYALKLGADTYLNKPIREDQLLQTVKTLLDQS
jgi:chemosensory pili system protein ChpA (sensor histidine kinase/response regulator)